MGEGDGVRGWWMLPPMECMFKIGDALGELGQFEERNRYIKKGIARCIRANASEALTQLLSVLEWNTKEIIKEWDENRKTAVREKCKAWLRLSYCFSVLYHDKVMENFAY